MSNKNQVAGQQGLSATFMFLAVLFCVCLIASNLFAVKIFSVWEWCVLPGAVIIFPVSYILNDCISEVYGYRRAQLVIWMAFAMNILFVLASQLVMILPGAAFWDGDEAFRYVFAAAPRATVASLAAFLVGSSVNAGVLSKLKVKSEGKRFGIRAILSSVAGELLDSMIFIPIMFWNTGVRTVLTMMACQVTAKVCYEIVVLPITSIVVRKLKAAENVDIYDRDINYNPFKLNL